MNMNGLAPIRKLDIGILRQTLNTDNINTDDSQIENKSIELLPEIFRLIASLDDDTQKMLLDSWAKMEMPLNEKTVGNLLQYLDNNPALTTEDKMAVIKAFAFLESNNLPFSEKLINALRSIFNNNGNLSSTFEQFMASENFLNKDQLNNLFSNLSLEDIKKSLLKIDDFSRQNQENVSSKSNLNNEQNNSSASKEAYQQETINTKNIDLNSQTLNKFMHLDPELKNIILNDSNKFNQIFDQNTIKILNNYLSNNNVEGITEKIALLKAFAFLENNQLPLTEGLIKETAAHFDKNIIQFTDNLTDKNQLFANLNNTKSTLISKNEAAVNLDVSKAQIKESLTAQSKISDQILNLFNKSGGENEEKIADNLLGQKLVNLQQQNQNTPLMLALEIPVQIPDNKLSSLLLKIEKEETEAGESDKNKMGYNISFILEFENIGPIQTNVNIKQNNISTTFFTESSKTANLIEENLEKLDSSLVKEGFTIENFSIKNFDNLIERKSQFFNKLILSELNNQDKEGKYQHIDIKI
ncbi:MAG: flagellar hook-length control protein FliK [Bacillota bacterium]